MTDWYVCVAGGEPVGPVSRELLLLGVESGKVPHDAYVCPVGETGWRRLVEVPTLATALPGPEAFRSADADARYTIRSKIGEGGMGEVHVCSDAWIVRNVALKVMRGEQSMHAEARARFVREARLQGQLEHPSIVPVYDLGTRADGTAFFTMKRVKGHTLHAVIHRLREKDPETRATFTRRKLLTSLSQVCLAVAFAHSRGVVHRDIKPDNVMLGDFGEVYVLDWGIAKVLEDSWAGQPARGADAPPGQTQVGSFVGTPGYAAPEQAKGEAMATGARSDVYSLGAVLFEVLALQPLHAGPTNEALIASTLTTPEGRPAQRAPELDIPPELDAICARATALEPAARFATARELHDELERFLDGERDQERRRELARSHLTAAEKAFRLAAQGGANAETQRAGGMRELGAALALEPSNAEAARTLLRVLLEAPAELPPAAEAELAQVDLKDRAAGARVGMLFYLATCLPGPFLTMLHFRRPLFGIAITIVLFAIVAYFAWMWRTGKAEPQQMRWAVMLSFLLVSMQSTLFGPLVVAPGAAAATAAVFLASIRASLSTRRWILVLSVASVFGPAALQVLGVLPASYGVVDGKLTIAPNLFDFEPTTSIAILAFSGALTIAATVLGVGRSVEALMTAERRNFAQAWRLRQILPGAEQASVR